MMTFKYNFESFNILLYNHMLFSVATVIFFFFTEMEADKQKVQTEKVQVTDT